MEKSRTPHALIILDGFGHRAAREYNAIANAHTPTLDMLMAHYPHALLNASGSAVGLPAQVAGNSEVGHMTLGAGRIIKQPALILNEAISNHSLGSLPSLTQALNQVHQSSGRLHLMGILSDAYVHGHEQHAFEFLRIAAKRGFSDIFVHAFLDGRDVAPKSAAGYIENLEGCFKKVGVGKLVSIHGRLYAMDRDNHSERTRKSFLTMTRASAITPLSSWQEVLEKSYAQDIFDECIEPTLLDPAGVIKEGDGILFWNYRPDRARQITRSFLNSSLNLSAFITPISYAGDLKTSVILPDRSIPHTLKEVLASHHYSLFSIAETEKYAHVTYFFNGGIEKMVPGEQRVLIPSLGCKSYAEKPAMSAAEITRTVCAHLNRTPADFYLINYANADMVGHSGDYEATRTAVECLDEQLKVLYEVIVKEKRGTLYITADHGKAEIMYDAAHQQKQTAHTGSLVPFIFITPSPSPISSTRLNLHQLSDVAPFILEQLKIPIPQEMRMCHL